MRERIKSKVVVALLNFFARNSMQAHKGTELRAYRGEKIGMKVFSPYKCKQGQLCFWFLVWRPFKYFGLD